MNTHVVVGSGPVGTRTALLLAEAGSRVRVVTRSGGGPEHPLVERVAADASDASAMQRYATGAAVIYNCANPKYTRWTTDWPPLAAALLVAAASTGAVLATVSNLYGYGRIEGPMGQDTPLNPCDPKGEVRVQMWHDTLAAHQAGRVRIVEVRASDYADAGANSHLARNAPAVLTSHRARVLGSADQPHSWSTTHDTARLAVQLAADESAHGKAWIVPSAPPRTQREALGDIARSAGAPPPRISVLGPRAMRAVGLFVPMLRELSGTAYQFTAPFVVDDEATRRHVGWEAEAWPTTVERVVGSARALSAAGAR